MRSIVFVSRNVSESAVEPTGADQLEATRPLDVHGAAMRSAPVHGDVAEDGERDPAIDDVARQVSEKRAVTRSLPDGVEQPRRQLRRPPDGPRVEIDAGGEHVLRPRLAHPAGEVPFPDRHRLAPGRIRGHRVARTPRKADVHEAPDRRVGEFRVVLGRPRGEMRRRVLVHEAVVLIGSERLLAPRLAPEGQPAVADRRRVLAGLLERAGGQRQDADHDPVVQLGDELADVVGRSRPRRRGAARAS